MPCSVDGSPAAGRRGADPNDRRVDREVERAARRMRPEVLDALLRDGEDD